MRALGVARLLFLFQPISLFCGVVVVAVVVSLAAVFWMSRNVSPTFGGTLRDIQKTAARETIAVAVLVSLTP